MGRGAVVDVLARSPAAPGALALVGAGRAWTYEQLGALVDRRADELARVVGSPGSAAATVAVPVGPDPRGVVELLAHWRAGLVPAPLDDRLPERRGAGAGLAGTPAGAQVVLWTSGSAGRPRGVALSFDNLRASVDAAARRLDLSEGDVWLASLGPSHVGGLVLVVRAILLGSCLVAAGRLGAPEMSDLLDGRWPEARADGHGAAAQGPTAFPDPARPVRAAGQAARPTPLRAAAPADGHAAPPAPPPLTHASLVPTQLRRLLGHRQGRPPPATFRSALVGGAHAPEGLVAEALGAGWPLALTYGMTETSSQAATAPPELVRRKPGTVGPPLEGLEIRVAGDGELLVRGAMLALGHVTSPADVPASDDSAVPATAPAEVPASGDSTPAATVPLTDDEGWYHTGDYGRLDEDGDLWVTGRRAERIVSGGVTVDALEVEEAVRAHPGVVEACVVGVPDEEWGERVGACVVPAAGGLDLEELDARLAARLAPPKRPRVWVVRPALPLNANGKPDRETVRRWLVEERG